MAVDVAKYERRAVLGGKRADRALHGSLPLVLEERRLGERSRVGGVEIHLVIRVGSEEAEERYDLAAAPLADLANREIRSYSIDVRRETVLGLVAPDRLVDTNECLLC